MVEASGLSVAEPLIAPPVSKPCPAQVSALVEPQVRIEDCPALISCGLADTLALGGSGVVVEPVAPQGTRLPYPNR